jgi:formylglycine-generating enzyme required for sulfatase activity
MGCALIWDGKTKSVRVSAVVPGSGAQQGGIRPFDAVLKVDGKPIGALSALSPILNAHNPGDTVVVEIERGGEVLECRVLLMSPEEIRSLAAKHSGTQPARSAEPSAQPSAQPTKPAQPYPLWDSSESVAEYAKRTGLEATKTLDLGGGVKLELVLIPAGKFIMGTPEPESPWIGGTILGAASLFALVLLAVLVVRAIRQRRRPQFTLRWLILLIALLGVAQYGGFRWWRAAEARKSFDADESPAHEVTLSRPYYLGKYEVTQEQYQQVTGTNPSNFKGRDLPVETVSWDEAQAFCKKIGERTGESVRLPSEAEWEYACRAGTRTRFYSGDADADLESVAWYDANSSGKTHPVGGKASNAWGVHDMHGNAWEWCADWFEAYKAEAVTDPQGPPQGANRVLRGGSWDYAPGGCRSALRWFDPDGRDFIGFRVVGLVPRTPVF